MKSFSSYSAEADKGHVVVGIVPGGKFEVSHSKSKKSLKGRAPKSKLVSTHDTIDDAKKAAKEYANKHGLEILK